MAFRLASSRLLAPFVGAVRGPLVFRTGLLRVPTAVLSTSAGSVGPPAGGASVAAAPALADGAAAAVTAPVPAATQPRSHVSDYIGVAALLSAIGALTWYLWRQKRAADSRRKLVEGLEEAAIICPGEIKELRDWNQVECVRPVRPQCHDCHLPSGVVWWVWGLPPGVVMSGASATQAACACPPMRVQARSIPSVCADGAHGLPQRHGDLCGV
jgi:hypothetical protein